MEQRIDKKVPAWFTLRGHTGVFRVDEIASRREGVVVLADVNGWEVGRCTVRELRTNIDGPA